MKCEAKKLRVKGIFVRKIAEKFGVSTVLVYSWLRQGAMLGQEMPPPKQLRIRPEAGKSNENARIVFASGIALEIPVNQVNKDLLQTLCEVQAYKMSLDLFRGDAIIFVGKGMRRIKVLYADVSGLWFSTELFASEAMKTKLLFLSEPHCDEISQSKLALIIDGSRYSIEKKVISYRL